MVMPKLTTEIEAASRLDHILSKLKEREFRITPQRIAVLKILAGSQEHPSAETIYKTVKKDFPTTSLATIYKTVTLAKELGEVMELGFSDGSNRYDGYNPNPHPHLICVQCKKIVDPDLKDFQEITRKIATDSGFEIINHRLDFFGVCPECRNKDRNKNRNKK